jgi:hypothetical protein
VTLRTSAGDFVVQRLSRIGFHVQATPTSDIVTVAPLTLGSIRPATLDGSIDPLVALLELAIAKETPLSVELIFDRPKPTADPPMLLTFTGCGVARWQRIDFSTGDLDTYGEAVLHCSAVRITALRVRGRDEHDPGRFLLTSDATGTFEAAAIEAPPLTSTDSLQSIRALDVRPSESALVSWLNQPGGTIESLAIKRVVDGKAVTKLTNAAPTRVTLFNPVRSATTDPLLEFLPSFDLGFESLKVVE